MTKINPTTARRLGRRAARLAARQLKADHTRMFKHIDGWALNARMLRLVTDDHPASKESESRKYIERIVREKIAQDRGLVWC